MGGEKIVIDLSNEQTYSLAVAFALAWGTIVMLVAYNIISDVVIARRGRKPRTGMRLDSLRGPCAPDLHEFTDGVCTTCGAEQPPA